MRGLRAFWPNWITSAGNFGVRGRTSDPEKGRSDDMPVRFMEARLQRRAAKPRFCLESRTARQHL